MYICKVVGMAAAVSTFAMVLSAAAICPTTSNNNTGADPTGCGVLITYPANGNPVVAITGTGAYDGSDDTTVGIINNTTSAITSISLNATDASDAFGFEGDGIQTYASDIQNGVPVGSGGATGYEGPNSTFNLSGVDSSGGGTLVVNFSGRGPEHGRRRNCRRAERSGAFNLRSFGHWHFRRVWPRPAPPEAFLITPSFFFPFRSAACLLAGCRALCFSRLSETHSGETHPPDRSGWLLRRDSSDRYL